MAEGYGRGGVATGGKGGTSMGGAYEFGAKAAGDYLSGTLANEYASATSTLSSQLPSKLGPTKVRSKLKSKLKAEESVGKLRDIAQANAVGSFMEFAGGMGRGSQARASGGFITGESFATTQAETTKTGKMNERQTARFQSLLSPTEFKGQAAMGYNDAAMGSAGALHRNLTAEGAAVDQAKMLGSTPVGGLFQQQPMNNFKGGAHSPYAAKQQAAQAKKKQQGILAMSPAERYFKGYSSF